MKDSIAGYGSVALWSVVGFAWLLRTIAEPLALKAGRLEIWALRNLDAD